MTGTISKIYRFYRDGFRSMTVGRSLWLIIIVKLIIIFAVLKLFFFPDALGGYDSDDMRADAVRQSLAAPASANSIVNNH